MGSQRSEIINGRPDKAYAVKTTQYCEQPAWENWAAIKSSIMYVVEQSNVVLVAIGKAELKRIDPVTLIGLVSFADVSLQMNYTLSSLKRR